MMKVGIIGSGDVGRKLADGLIELGHSVRIGSRDPNQSKICEWISKHGKENASAGTFADTAVFGDIIVLATLWTGTPEAIHLADPQNLANKIVIDVTNPLDFSKGVPPRLALGHTDSAGETIQRMLPDSKVVKSFNIVGNSHMIHPDFPGESPPCLFVEMMKMPKKL